MIRNATPQDAEAIAAIYNHAVTATTAIWNETIVDAENRRAWLVGRIADGFPVLVAQQGEVVIGYASYGPWRAFEGFRETVEHSVYVAPDAQGAGIGRELMRALIRQAKDDGLHVMIAGIEAGNKGSIRLHQSLGFTQTGLMPQVGQKFGRWLDLVFMQLVLDDRPTP
jgi:phosphinothricin acetyltransferase